MTKIINLDDVVFRREQYKNIINTNFTELISISPPPSPPLEYSIYDFFNDYQRLYPSIPDEGEFNSKQYIIQRSGNYFYEQALTETIEELTLELLELIIQLSEKQQEFFKIITDPLISGSLST
jgi:hypothetical protein